MKVLKHGSAYRDPNAQFEVTCPFCDCQFVYTDEEVKFESFNGTSVDLIYCPECRRPNFVDDRWDTIKPDA